MTEPCTPREQLLAFSAELRNAIQARNILTAKTKQKVLRDLENISTSNEEIQRQALRKKAINEILTSEVTYLHQLELVMKYFMDPLKDKKLLQLDDFTLLFGHISTINSVNKELLAELDNGRGNIAKAFLKLAPFFKLYSAYAYDYRNCLILLQELQVKNKEFSKFLEQQESRPEVSQKLSALLITPIQRVPRYRLLLQQVLAYTLPQSADHSLLLESLNAIEKVAFHINGLVREQENAQRMLELQRSLCGGSPNIVRPGRHLLKEGPVMKMSRNSARGYRRYIVLMSDILMYCKLVGTRPVQPGSLQCCCILPLHKCRITEIASKGVFTVTCQEEALIFYCESAKEVGEWITALQDAIAKYVECRKTLRKDSSSRRPIRKRNIVEFDQAIISPGEPRRKRKLPVKEEFDDIYRSSDIDSDSDSENKKSYFKFPLKRAKKETTAVKKILVKNNKEIEPRDILYPLRTDLKPVAEETCQHEVEIADNVYGFELQTKAVQPESKISKIRTFFSDVTHSVMNVFKYTGLYNK